MRIGLTAIAALLAALPRPAQAENRVIEVTPTAAWGHAETGMILPSRVGGLVRTRIEDSTQYEMDVAVTYADRDEQMVAVVYLYRIGAGDVPVWFDRAVGSIILSQQGAPYPAITPFTRPGASVASGLRAAMTDNVAGMRSTAVAVAPLGSGYLLKVRMGSARLEPAALEERLGAFVTALRWPAEAAGTRAAVPVEPCPSPLRLREARIVRTDGANVLMDSIIGTMQPEPGQHAPPPPVYCREPGATVERGVYRPDRSRDSYLIALSDSGLAVSVGEALDIAALSGQASGGRRFAVTLWERNASSAYPSFNRLPPPDQALALVRNGSPLSTTSGNDIGISSGALGNH